MGRDDARPGAASLVLVDGVPLLHPETQVFEAMLEGWRNQGVARNLAVSTLTTRESQVRRFAAHANAFPWQWSPQVADEWFADLRAIRHCSRSTVRGYQVAVRGFCGFLTDPGYGWPEECEKRFGTHPVQVINEVNSAAHVADSESEPSKRAFTRAELQALFDFADEQVGGKQALGRKGWLSAFRDATLLQGRLLVRAATHRDPDAGRGRFRAEPAGAGVRRVRGGLRPARQGQAGIAAETAQCADGVAVDRPRSWSSGSARSGRCSGSTATRRPGRPSGAAGRPGGAQPSAVGLPGGARPGPGAWTSTRCAAPMSRI